MKKCIDCNVEISMNSIRCKSCSNRKRKGTYHFSHGHSEETKRKIGEGNRKENISLEARYKRGNSMRGKKHKIETLSLMRYKKLGENNPFWGKHHSEKSKESMSKTLSKIMTGKVFTEEHKSNISKSIKTRLKNNPQMLEELKERGRRVIVPFKDTSIEIKIQNFLKQLGITFFTHQYMKEIEHRYCCDILVPSMNLVIECDGDYWHKYPIGTDLDKIKTKELIEKGFKVLRLWERDIKIMDLSKFSSILKNV